MSYKTRLAWREKRRRCDDHLTGWLRDRGSLTARLQGHGSFAVRLLRQGLARPTRDEALALGVQPDRLLWIREVALLVDGRPLVFAHTVLARRPRGPLSRAFQRLGNNSLGALLFAHPAIARGPLCCKRLDARHPLFATAIAALQAGAQASVATPSTLWARRSRFAFGAQSVLVSEVFAPAIAAWTPE